MCSSDLRRQLAQLRELVRGLASVDPRTLEPEVLTETLRDTSTLVTQLQSVQVGLTGAFNESGQWQQAGFRSAAQWLSARAHLTTHASGRLVGLAGKLSEMPHTADALASGRVSLLQAQQLASLVRQETAASFAADEAELVAAVARTPANRTARIIEEWRHAHRDPSLTEDQRRYESRSVAIHTDVDGMTSLRAILQPELAMKTEHLLGTLVDLDRRHAPKDDTRSFNQYLADAFARMVDLARAHLDLQHARATTDTRLVVNVDLEALTTGTGHALHLNSGLTITAETARRIACDCGVNRHIMKGKSVLLERGREVRCATDQQRAAIHARDRGCAHPECDWPPRWCWVHHIDEWVADDGETNVDRMVALCSAHHRMVHEEGWIIERDVGTGIVTFDPPLAHAPPVAA